MRVGMMWQLENSKKPLASKLQQALNYYHAKYGGQANQVVIHPAQVDPIPPHIDGVEIKISSQVLPGCAWIGVEDDR